MTILSPNEQSPDIELTSPPPNHPSAAPLPLRPTINDQEGNDPSVIRFHASVTNEWNDDEGIERKEVHGGGQGAVHLPDHHSDLINPLTAGRVNSGIGFGGVIIGGKSLWKDGRVSVEQHLDLYIEDLMVLSSATAGQTADDNENNDNNNNANAKQSEAEEKKNQNIPPVAVALDIDEYAAEDITLPDVLRGVHYLFMTRIHHKLSNLSLDQCSRLTVALLHHVRRSHKSFALKPRPTPSGELALLILIGFLQEVEEMKINLVEKYDPTTLCRALKLHRHWRSSDENHKKNIIRFLKFISTDNILAEKFSDWKTLINRDVHKEIETAMSAAAGDVKVDAFHKSFRVQNNLPPKGSYYDTSEEKVLQAFKTDSHTGLADEEIEKRRKMYGTNDLPPPQSESLIHMFLKQFKDFIMIILLVSAIVSFAIEDFKAGVVLFIVIIINSSIGFIQEYKARNALLALSSLSVPLATVLRGGHQNNIPSSDLVPGDIVILDEGGSVPADLRLIEVSQLSIVESLLTGESVAVTKTTAPLRGKRAGLGDRTNMAFMSTLVAKGRGKGVVVNVGLSTEIGRIYHAITNTQLLETPLQKKLAGMGKKLVIIAIIACALIIIIGIARGYGTDIIKIGISLAISVIPEGLLTVATLTLAIGTQRMARQNAIVRRLPAVEALGSCTTICSDKTGTLTEGKMKAEEMWVLPSNLLLSQSQSSSSSSSSSSSLSLSGDKIRFEGGALDLRSGCARLSSTNAIIDLSSLSSSYQYKLLICALCNNASIVIDPSSPPDSPPTTVGDATELALLIASRRAKAGEDYWKNNIALDRVAEFAFDSDRKRMSVVIKLSKEIIDKKQLLGLDLPSDARYVLLCKGASEAILDRCTHALLSPPSPSSLSLSSSSSSSSSAPVIVSRSDSIDSSFEREGTHLARGGMRVLASAFRFLSEEEYRSINTDIAIERKREATGNNSSVLTEEEINVLTDSAESNLIAVGLIGIVDPPRSGVSDAISTCHAAGIRVCMVTGDHAETAVAIAKQIGIFRDATQDKMLKGDALAVLSEDQLAALQPFPVVFSRVSPENKLKIVKALQRNGEVVAMTGDGCNDAAAIRQADVGIAMGLNGTEITRQAADIILADDNFATIVLAVAEGRGIYENIVKFIVYLLICNSADVLIMLMSVVVGIKVPFLSMMILWANIFADVPPSLSMGIEPQEIGIMKQPPRNPSEGFMNGFRSLIIIINSIELCVLGMIPYYYFLYHIEPKDELMAQSMIFLLTALSHIIHAFITRSLIETIFSIEMILRNTSMIVAFTISVAFMLFGNYVPVINQLLQQKPLNSTSWAVIGCALSFHVVFVESEKVILRWYTRRYLTPSSEY